MSTAGIEFIRNEMDWDKYDPWGSVQSARFDLAEAFWHATGLKVKDYEPSPVMVQGELEEGSRVQRLCEAMRDWKVIRFNDIYYWFRVLNRMRDLVVKAGRDY